ncbi:MAG: endonuclease domain-containing protein [Solirubrobacteraceae bacterium]
MPEPLVNKDVLGGSGRWHEVDFLWPEQRLIVETDGNAFHSTRRSIERDRRKEADLVRAGYRVLRFTWSQIEHAPEEVVRMLRAALRG